MTYYVVYYAEDDGFNTYYEVVGVKARLEDAKLCMQMKINQSLEYFDIPVEDFDIQKEEDYTRYSDGDFWFKVGYQVVEEKQERLWKNCADYQGTNFAIGRTMTAREWGQQAKEWADNWDNPDQCLLENFKSEEDLIAYINDMWEINIKPQEEWTPEEELLEED